jgi:hypothetical protein
MCHERAILSRPPLLRRAEIRLDREPKLLQVRAAFSAERKHMRSLAIARHRQCAKAQDIVIINEALQSTLDIAIVIIEVRVQKPACLCGGKVMEAPKGKKY